MSKQSEAKKDQGYRVHSNTCGNCGQFQSEVVLPAWCVNENVLREETGGPPFYILSETHGGIERNLRCSVGGFAVKKTATCDQHVLKEKA